MVEDVVGCKWSLAVLGAVRGGVRRPGAMEHAIEGLSKKVLNERLRKLVRFGVLDKRSYPEVPPRAEYTLTPLGHSLLDPLRVLCLWANARYSDVEASRRAYDAATTRRRRVA